MRLQRAATSRSAAMVTVWQSMASRWCWRRTSSPAMASSTSSTRCSSLTQVKHTFPCHSANTNICSNHFAISIFSAMPTCRFHVTRISQGSDGAGGRVPEYFHRHGVRTGLSRCHAPADRVHTSRSPQRCVHQWVDLQTSFFGQQSSTVVMSKLKPWQKTLKCFAQRDGKVTFCPPKICNSFQLFHYTFNTFLRGNLV